MLYDFTDPLHWMVYGKPGATVALTRQTITPVIPANGSGSSTVDGISFTTGSITFDPLKQYVACFEVAAAIAPSQPTLDGWTVVTSNQVGSGLNRRKTVFRASGLSGAATLTFAGGGETWTSGCWIVVELPSVDLASPLPQAAQVAGSGAANNTTFTTTLSAFEHETNINLTFVGLGSNASVTHDANFAELADVAIGSGTLTLEAQWCVNRVACTPTWTSAGACVTSIEVKSALA
jgi:hypothetical protein